MPQQSLIVVVVDDKQQDPYPPKKMAAIPPLPARVRQYGKLFGTTRAPDVNTVGFDTLGGAQQEFGQLTQVLRDDIRNTKVLIGNELIARFHALQRNNPPPPFQLPFQQWDGMVDVENYYKQFLLTPVRWQPQLTMMDLLLYAYAYLGYLVTAITQRDFHFSTRSGIGAGGWTQVKEGFVSEFAAFLTFILLRGPTTTHAEMTNSYMSEMDHDDPIFPFFVQPIWQMVSNHFPSIFRYKTAYEYEIKNFVAKHNRRVKDYGVYSFTIMDQRLGVDRGVRTRRTGQPISFLKGQFFPIFQILTLLSPSFPKVYAVATPRNRNGNSRPIVYNCTPAEEREIMEQMPVSYTVTFRGRQPITVYGHPLWYEPREVYDPVAQRPRQPPGPPDPEDPNRQATV
jgi:hypothetical protein